jgi:quinol monooxygenase YgiN
MIVSTIRIRANPQHQRELLQVLQAMLEPIRKAAGCRAATLYQDVDNEDVVSLQADWETQAEMEQHVRSEIFCVLRGAIKTLSRHEAAEARVLSWMAGMEAIIALRGEK